QRRLVTLDDLACLRSTLRNRRPDRSRPVSVGVLRTARRERRRQCNNPRPQYGGRPCVGEARTAEMCDAKCIDPTSQICPRSSVVQPQPKPGATPTVHGKWGEWSPWSYCGPDCRSSRQRACNSRRQETAASRALMQTLERTAAAPATAATASVGKKIRLCCATSTDRMDDQHVPNLNNVAIYIGLFVAAAVIVTVAVVIVYLVRKKSVSFTAGRRVPRYNIHMNAPNSDAAKPDEKMAVPLYANARFMHRAQAE
uniref:TSP1_CCN domain-containing protein n=1 Tax=Macrostomum lignano TaxID=282301 RepID=A0A1I8F2I9_9PLAT